MGRVYSKSTATAPARRSSGASPPPTGRRGAARFLAEAQRLHALLCDGATALGYHVRRGLALRHADSKQPILGSYTEEWRPARELCADGSERDRRLNPFVLRQHLAGKYDVAWQAPSWTSLVVLDIDRPELDSAERGDPERELQADSARDQVLAAVWDAFGFDRDKQPVILRSPGDGYHVYLPLERGGDATERTWPAAWAREHIEHHLNRHGVALHPGRLELFPSGIRLRAPCGAGSAVLVPTRPDFSDDLGLELHGARWRRFRDRATGAETHRLIRDVEALVARFCDDLEAARRPLEAWLGRDRHCWHAVWGPWGRNDPAAAENPAGSARANALSRHKEEVPKRTGPLPSSAPIDPIPSLAPSGGWLLYGAAFRGRVEDLAAHGLSSAGQRHDAALKLTWYWGKCRGLDRSTTLARVREWLTGFEHVSATRDRSRHAFVRDTMREVAHYYDRRVVPAGRAVRVRGADLVLRPLAEVDRAALLEPVPTELRSAVEPIVRFLFGVSDGDGWVAHPVNLSGRILGALVGERRLRVVGPDGVVQRRRAAVVAVEELVRLGVLAVHTDYSTGRHGRLYTCWYRFGSGALPAEVDGRLVVAVRDIEEGRLTVVADRRGDLAVGLEPASSRSGGAPPSGAEPWWVRMYRRRAFTPAEFFEGDRRTVLPGPFRHRRRKGELARGGADPGPPPGAVPPPDRGPPSGAGPPPCPDLGTGDPVDRPLEHGWRRWLRRRQE